MIDGGEWSSKRSGWVVFVYKRRNAGLPTANPTCRTEKPVALSSSVYVIGQARSSDVLTDCKFHLPPPWILEHTACTKITLQWVDLCKELVAASGTDC